MSALVPVVQPLQAFRSRWTSRTADGLGNPPQARPPPPDVSCPELPARSDRAHGALGEDAVPRPQTRHRLRVDQRGSARPGLTPISESMTGVIQALSGPGRHPGRPPHRPARKMVRTIIPRQDHRGHRRPGDHRGPVRARAHRAGGQHVPGCRCWDTMVGLPCGPEGSASPVRSSATRPDPASGPVPAPDLVFATADGYITAGRGPPDAEWGPACGRAFGCEAFDRGRTLSHGRRAGSRTSWSGARSWSRGDRQVAERGDPRPTPRPERARRAGPLAQRGDRGSPRVVENRTIEIHDDPVLGAVPPTPVPGRPASRRPPSAVRGDGAPVLGARQRGCAGRTRIRAPGDDRGVAPGPGTLHREGPRPS